MNTGLWLFIGGVFLAIIVAKIQNFMQRKCPKCKSMFGVIEISKENLGDFLPPNDRNTYRIKYYCTNCDNSWSIIDVEDSSG